MSSESHNSDTSSNPAPSTEPILRRAVACLGCRYNLEGLRANGRCPECGTNILETLASSIDLETDQLEPIEYGSRFGGALLLIVVCTFSATSATVGPVAYFLADSLGALPNAGSSSGLRDALDLGAAALLAFARIGAALGVLVSGPILWRARSFDRIQFVSVTRSRLLICGGFCLWLVALSPSIASLSLPLATYAAIPATMVLIGLHPLIRAAGERSKIYRGSVARQPVGLLTLACGVAGVASLTKIFLQVGVPQTEDWQHLLGIVALTSFGLLEIGLLYLVLNAWWIWRALASPPPRLDSLLQTPKS